MMKAIILVFFTLYFQFGVDLYAQNQKTPPPEVNVLLADSAGNVLDIKKPISLKIHKQLRLVCKPENSSNATTEYEVNRCSVTFFRKGRAVTSTIFAFAILDVSLLNLQKKDGATVTIGQVSKLDSNGNRIPVRNRTPVFSFYFE